MAGGRITRDELLSGGLGGRTASTALFAIENRVRHAASTNRRAASGWEAATAQHGKQVDFLSSIAAGRDEQVELTGIDLERYASTWTDLTPASLTARSALLDAMARKYDLPYARVRGIRQALGADDADFAAEFGRKTEQLVEDVLDADVSVRDRLAWRWVPAARAIENLSAFWITFTLILTTTIGGGILAVPLVFSQFGLATSAVILAIGGLVSSLAMGSFAEALARSAPAASQSGTMSSLTGHYLGSRAAAAITAVMTIDILIVMVGFTYGFGRNMAEATGFGGPFWAAALAIAVVLLLRRDSLDATVAVAMLIGLINMLMLGILIVLALTKFNSDNLTSLGTWRLPDRGIAPALGALFGFTAGIFAGPVGVLNASSLVLRKDPSGRALRRGTHTAIAGATVVYLAFLLATLGAVPASALVDETATVIGPLTDIAGSGVATAAIVYAPLAMGIVTVQYALGLKNQVREWTQRRGLGSWLASVPTILSAGLGVVLLTGLSGGVDVLTDSLSLGGALIDPVIKGAAPTLLLFAARRRGRQWTNDILGSTTFPFAAIAVAVFFLAGMAFHAVLIWVNPISRALMGLTLALILIAIADSLRSKRFAPLLFVGLERGTATRGPRRLALLLRSEPTELDAKLSETEDIVPLRHEAVIDARVGSIDFALPIETEVAIDLGLAPADAEGAQVFYIDPDGSKNEVSASQDDGTYRFIGLAKSRFLVLGPTRRRMSPADHSPRGEATS